ncbi:MULTISPECIES: thiamine phosphate synthase [Bacillus]|uniref:thiamine phosphate synthase n=1 Tax=Bacillus TaxID=1386 RepID=UPI000BB7F634|nr:MULTISPECIES: thiamine phosphate synthase [Bacillus]
MNVTKQHMQVYFVMGSTNCLKSPTEVLKEAIDGGITFFQFREKGEGSKVGEEKFQLAKQLMDICRANQVPFVVNDDIDLAMRLNADGVHIGQEDGNIEEVRKLIGNKILGVSTHNVEEAQEAQKKGADYIGVGPMFFTSTKEDIEEVKGPSVISSIRKAGVELPIVGIGGISTENAEEVVQAGADGVAVISAISKALSPNKAVMELKKKVAK